MKRITFKQQAAQRIYDDYINRIERTVKSLGAKDKEDVLMEFNSHIYESCQQLEANSEVDKLLDVVQKLGAPEEVLQPLLAEKKLEQATRTFNPVHVFKAIVLNIGNGISFMILGLLYLMLFIFVFTIFWKLLQPNEIGFFIGEGDFYIGAANWEKLQSGAIREVLGNWFIPVMIVVSMVWYFVITLLLKLKNYFNNTNK